MKSITRLSKREKTLFYLTLAVVGFGLALKFLLEPLGGLNQRLGEELKSKQIQLMHARQLAQGESIQTEYDNFISAIRMSESEEMELVRLLSEIERMAKEAGVNILNIRPRDIEDRKFYKKFSMELKLEGPNRQTLQFIFLLESSPLLFRIDKFNLSARASKRGLLNTTLSVSRLAIP